MKPKKQHVTYKEACEIISKSKILEKDGVNPTWEQIWNYSPTGELDMIDEWYEIASALEEHKEELEEK